MATSWDGSISLLTGETARVKADCVMHDSAGLELRLQVPGSDIDIRCVWDGHSFACSHPGVDGLVSACELLYANTLEPTFQIDVKFKALTDGNATVSLSFISGNADIENVTLAAE